MKTISDVAVASALLLILVSSFGCRCADGLFGVDKCADVPRGATPDPPGSHLCEWQHAQVANASIDRGMFYQADFVDTSDRLAPAAVQRIDTLVQQGAIGTVALYVEPSGDAQRDASRVLSVASTVSESGVPITPDQVQIAYPPAIGLDGFRAQQVARAASRSGNQGGQGGQGGSGQGGGGLGGGGVGGGGLGGGVGGGGLGGGGFF